MGLIKKNKYEVLGIELNQAYAKIQRLYIENGSQAKAYFGISSNRENLNSGLYLEEKTLECDVDKSRNIYEQIYMEAKKDMFKNWEDDIVEEVND